MGEPARTDSVPSRVPLEVRFASAWRSGPFGVRDFKLLSLAQLASTLGDYCYAVALPWLILSNNGSTVLLGTVLACYGVPRTVLIPVGGVLSDRLTPRSVMLVATVTRCVLVAALVALAGLRLISLAYLGPIAALLGAGEGLFLPASNAIMPSLLPEGDLQAGNGLAQAMVQIGSIAGPVLGGALVTTLGPPVAFAADLAAFVLSSAALAVMRSHAPAHEAADPDDQATPADASEQITIWRLLLRSRVLQIIVVIALLANFAIAGTLDIALPALAHERFGAAGYGALIACFGFGSLVGTIGAIKLDALRPAQAVSLSFLVGAIALAVLPFAGVLPLVAMASLFFGAAVVFGNIVVITVLQRWAPAVLLGRVMSVVMLAGIGAYPASVALSGVIVRAVGPVPFFPVAGAVLAMAILLALTRGQFRTFGTAQSAIDLGKVCP